MLAQQGFEVLSRKKRFPSRCGKGDRLHQWWVNHDCETYINRYIELHRSYALDVRVGIAFWFGAPANRKQRLKLESDLIYKWRLPFNKECWQWWGQPFGK
ncbi:hypothetical protein QUB05_02720 [Microcoleus sp. F10-C6]